MMGADLPCRLKPGHPRHRHVEHGHVRALRERPLDRLEAVLRLRGHGHVRLPVDQHREPGAHDAVVVGDEDLDHGSLIVISVPAPGAERTSSSPPTRRARSAMP